MVQVIKDFYNKIKEYLVLFFGLVSAIFFTLFLYEKRKSDVSDVINKNLEVTNKVDDINNQISKVENDTEKKENEDVSQSDLLNFLNNDDSSNK